MLSCGTLLAQDSVKPKKAPDKPAEKAEKKEPAKDSKDSKESDKSGAREANYLDLVHARDKALRMKEDNLRDIQLLNALAAAMPEAVDKNTSQQVADEYKEALKLVYRLDYVEAEKLLRKNRENINSAMAKSCEAYRKKTAEMLNSSADTMAELEMQAENTGNADAIRMAGVVQRNQHRLAVGYQQLALAVAAERNSRFAEALSHYRLARLHAIHLQIELAKDENEKNALRAKYRNELGDRVAEPPASKEAAGEKKNR